MASKLTVAKIVASATPLAWSQAYHAGSFTAVISVVPSDSAAEPVEETVLHKTGKEILDTLIAEYFTLTSKDLQTVRAAVETTVAKLPEDFVLSMVVGAAVKNILYIVVVNKGKALLKRGEKAGVLLELEGDEENHIESVSGYLESGDIILLETSQFDAVFPQHELVETIDHHVPADIAEALAPKVHGSQEGGASAIVFSYQEEEPTVLEQYSPPVSPDEEKQSHQTFLAHTQDKNEEDEEVERPKEQRPQEEVEEKPSRTISVGLQENAETEDSFFAKGPLQQKKGFSLSHSQKIFLTIAIILTIVLFSSIFFFLSRQQAAKDEELFQSIYTPAKTKYDEGVSLMDLNKTLALSDLQQAKDMLTPYESKFSPDSSQKKQVDGLLSQINASLTTAQQVNTVDTTKAADNASPLLTFASKHMDALYIAQDDTNFYYADNTGVTQVNKSTSKAKQIITNGSDWKQIGGLGAYLGNVYVLDTNDGILKYVNGTSKQTYFAGSSPDLSKAVSLAIDGSIWVLSSDGTISKYIRGKQDSFTVSGLDKPFSNPTSIVTSVDDDNMYILDKGNGRLVVLKKADGSYVAQYQTGIIKNADGLDVDEKDKKAYILSGGTIYELDMN